MINKGFAATATVLFVGLIQTTNPPLWFVAALSIVLYEVGLLTIKIAKRESRKKQRRQYIAATRADMRRVEDEVFNPLRRMREVSI